MSISYNAIRGNIAKATNPSIESWGTNNNIVRDPPKSIMTRRRDKVDARGEMNELYANSGDRFSDSLTVYARGVNPMVSVEYTNANGAPAKMPYRILQNGAFRPPARAGQDLLPMSRRPRAFVPVCTGKNWIDFTKTVSCARDQKFREIKPEIIHPETKTNLFFQIANPVKEHFTVKYVIEKPILPTAHTNMNSKANIVMENKEHKNITDRELPTSSAFTNLHGPDKIEYIHDELQLNRSQPLAPAATNLSESRYIRIDADNELEFERNVPLAPATTNVSENRYVKIAAENELQFDRNMPIGNMTSNVSSSINFVNNNSVDFSRARKRNLLTSSFEGSGAKPMMYRENNNVAMRASTKSAHNNQY